MQPDQPPNTSPGARRARLGRAAGGLAAFAVGFAGACIFWLADMPLPWMLGAMAATAIAAIIGADWAVHRQARDLARPVIGVLAGSAFTPAIIDQAGAWVGLMLLVLAFSTACTLGGFVVGRKFFGFDRPTAFFASTPAGLTEMSLMGDSLGADIRSLFLIHSIRVVFVVFSIPMLLRLLTDEDLGTTVSVVSNAGGANAVDWGLLLLCGVAGYLLSRRFKIPGGVMIYSMSLSAILHLTGLTAAAPPVWLVIVVQVTIGCVAGARFRDVRWSEMAGPVIFGFTWAAVVVGSAMGVAVGASALTGREFGSILLAIAPGGMMEMTLVAYALGVDAALVIACQIVRNFSTILFAPMVYRLLKD